MIEKWPYKNARWALLLLEDCAEKYRSHLEGIVCPGCIVSAEEYRFNSNSKKRNASCICEYCIFDVDNTDCNSFGMGLMQDINENYNL